MTSSNYDDQAKEIIKIKIRLDFKGESKARFFQGNKKNIEKAAEETREQQVALIRNIPFQGVDIENIDQDMETYLVQNETDGEVAAYAPAVITLTAEALEDIIKFIMREELRKIEISEPEKIVFTKQEAEKFLFKIYQELINYKIGLEKKHNIK